VIKYNDEPFNVLAYLNMNRIAKAERLVCQSHDKMKSLLKLSFVLKVQSAGLVLKCAVRWLKKTRASKAARLINEDDSMSLDEEPIPVTPISAPS
jgi:hypothetical protein